MAYNNGYTSPFRQQTGQMSMFDGTPGSNTTSGMQPTSQLNLYSPAQNQLQNFQGRMGSGNPGYGGYGTTDSSGNLINGGGNTQGQNSPWAFGGVGGKAATGIAGLSTLGSLYLGNEARKLGAADLDFRRNSYSDQYAAQRALQNDQMFDRQQFRMAESGMTPEQAKAAADMYVSERGVQQRKA